MRKIKFRAKRIDNNKWIYGYYSRYFCNNMNWHNITDDFGNDFEIEKRTLGQFTGLFDRHGKEIYEGDIVEYISKDNYGGEQGKSDVYWCDKSVGFRPFSNDNELDCRELEEIIIIGNIFDNKELITKK